MIHICPLELAALVAAIPILSRAALSLVALARALARALSEVEVS